MPTFEPLRGVRVVDVTTSLAGPYSSEILASLGADVVKVESPDGGDEARHWGPPFLDGEGILFLSANASKRSLALSFREERGREALLRLAEGAGVFVVSLRPGLAEQRGLGPEEVRARNPELVYCTIGAFGNRGPLRGDAGYDPLVQSFSGITSVTGESDRPGVRVGVSIVDLATGLWAALAIVSAVLAGGGRTLELSLYEVALNLLGYHVTGALATGEAPGRHGTAFPLIAPYQVLPTRDGELALAVGNDSLWTRLRSALELDEDERFATNPARVHNRTALAALVSERLRARDTDDWIAVLRAAGVPAAPVQDVLEAARHAQTDALGVLQQLGSATVVAPPLSADGERVVHRAPAPPLGAHTREVLREAGYDDETVDALIADGIARSAP
jgi:crotonobetainyl-CoA:carnitine CoA-transferase CaiB-like acyl-CoA transferase